MKLSSFSLLLSLGLAVTACGDDGGGTGGGSGGGTGTGGDTSSPTSTSSSSSSTGPGSSGSGGDPTGGGGDPTGGGGDPTGGGGDPTGGGGAPACDNDGFVAVAEDAGPAFGFFNYIAQSTDGTPFDALKFELLTGEGETGARTITDDDYSTCDPCVLVYTACDDELTCERTFLANTGTLEVDTFDATFAGTLRDAVLVEVTIDEDLVSTPVEGGETWCIGEFAFDAINQGAE